MFESISLRNFQGHVNTTLQLVPGINVITGQSNVGKSSIMRALVWVLRNRPSGAGEHFKHWDTPKGEGVSVTIGLRGGTFVSRFRQGTKNGYVLGNEGDPEGQTELVAIRTDVPDEVVDILNLGDHNLQVQHEPYFLIAATAGEVARSLNRVCGLDIIDVALRTAESMLNQNTQDSNAADCRLEDLELLLGGYQDLEEREGLVVGLEGAWKEWHALGKRAEDIDRAAKRAKTAQDQVRLLEEFLGVEKALQRMEDGLASVVKLDAQADKLIHAAQRVKTSNRAIVEAEEAVMAATEEYNALLADLGVCPMCGNEFNQEENHA